MLEDFHNKKFFKMERQPTALEIYLTVKTKKKKIEHTKRKFLILIRKRPKIELKNWVKGMTGSL